MPQPGSKPSGPIIDDTRYKLALNLFDTDRMAPELRSKLLAGKVNLKETVNVDLDRVQTSVAIVFTCDLLTAALVIDIVRSEDRKVNGPLTRAYINRGGTAWSRLPNNVVLTVAEAGKPTRLNPQIFAEKEEEVVLLPLIPRKPKKLILGDE